MFTLCSHSAFEFFPGELYLALVTSTKAHARIISVDTSEALSLAGVKAYVDHRDIPGVNLLGASRFDEEVFASDRVSLRPEYSFVFPNK